MGKIIVHSLVVVWHLIALAITSIALCSDATVADESWQLTRLLHPSQAGPLDESTVDIVNHDGLTDKTLHTALLSHFDGIGAMTFTSVVETTQQTIP